MKLKCLKIIYILFLVFCINCIFINSIYIVNASAFENELRSLNTSNDNTNASSKVRKATDTVFVAVQVVGVAVAFIMLGVLGAKYMIASPGDRADIKKSAWVYLLGAIIIFGTTGILKLIQMFSNVFN